jgi:lipopolysaccharide biosynthesis protein
MVTSASSNFTISGLSANWDFQPSRVLRWERRQVVELFLQNAHKRPAWKEVKALKPKHRWVAYFMYAPDGVLSPTHIFTLSRLRDLGLPLLVVCASPHPNRLPSKLAGFCDALFWKDLPGYDFSAYTLALRQISQRSPNADVFVLNDSVFGPFSDFRTCIEKSPWDLTGFTASSQLTNHIQSYAFSLRNVDRWRMAALTPVFFPFASISSPQAVIRVQELRMARVAARSMKVGAFWFADTKDAVDPVIARPLELIDTGFPFLKRSLLSKLKGYVDQDLMLSRLQQLGHPIDIQSISR